jgi:hypothetical protein
MAQLGTQQRLAHTGQEVELEARHVTHAVTVLPPFQESAQRDLRNMAVVRVRQHGPAYECHHGKGQRYRGQIARQLLGDR